MALRRKQLVFVEEYLRCWNASEAARRAGYSTKNANVVGPRLLANVGISRAIDARMAELKMGADEVLVTVSDIARNSSMEHFLRPQGDDLVLDFSQAQGKLHYLRKVTRTRRTINGVTEETLAIEVHDPMRARELIGRHHRLFATQLEVDWRGEIEQIGLDPDAALSELERQFVDHLRQGAAGAAARGVDAGESEA